MTLPTSVQAFAPATVANVACGFDVLGLALEAPGDVVLAQRDDARGIVLGSVSGDGGRLPREAEQNTATVAARKLLDRLGVEAPGLRLDLRKGLPLASGMGSSAASAVAAVVAVDRLLDLRSPEEELLLAALEGERVVSGSRHADNAAACLYGGFVLVRSIEPVDVVRLPVPEGLSVAVLRPHLEMSTRDSRLLLGDRVELANAVSQWANLGALVAALYENDLDLVSRSLVDVVAEPLRAPRVPGFAEVQRAALDAGALGASLSGSGPSIFALCGDPERAEEAGRRMREALTKASGLHSDLYVSPICPRGARALPPEAED